jgi:probable rRNA maturation factor
MVEVDVLGATARGLGRPGGEEGVHGRLSREAVAGLCRRAATARGVGEGHLAVHFVGEARIAELNGAHRGKPVPTDVLAFPIDGAPGPADGAHVSAEGGPGSAEGPGPPRELGDVFVCPARARDLAEAIVHGVLHLTGMDHERDRGEMLALQARLLRS